MVKDVLGKYIQENFKLFDVKDKYADQLTEAEKLALITEQKPLIIKDMLSYDVLAGEEGQEDLYTVDLLDLFYYHIVTDSEGKLVDVDAMRKEIESYCPNYFLFNPYVVDQYIRKGYEYIFNPMGIEHITEEDKETRKRFTIVNEHLTHGVSSKSGFLDISDTLFDCVFFDNEGKEIDIQPLRDLFLNRWKTNDSVEQ